MKDVAMTNDIMNTLSGWMSGSGSAVTLSVAVSKIRSVGGKEKRVDKSDRRMDKKKKKQVFFYQLEIY